MYTYVCAEGLNGPYLEIEQDRISSNKASSSTLKEGSPKNVNMLLTTAKPNIFMEKLKSSEARPKPCQASRGYERLEQPAFRARSEFRVG